MRTSSTFYRALFTSLLFLGLSALSCGQAFAEDKTDRNDEQLIKPDTALLTAAARPDADRARDTQRKPLDLLALVPLPPKAAVADLMPGSGYFTRLLSLEVGASGHVFAVIPAEMVARHPQLSQTAQAIAADPVFANVSVVVTPLTDFRVSEPLDLVWTSQNYHDVYGSMGPDTALHMDQAIFQALKPGGFFMVIDHVALPGSGVMAPTTLHRIDPALIISQVESAGFQLVITSAVLHNPSDTHTLPVFNKSIRGHTDQIVLLFQKPRATSHGN